jgi:hypothetical protein
VEDVLAVLPADWIVLAPKRTAEGWEVAAQPRHPLSRLVARAVGFGATPDEALHNLVVALREDNFEDDEP